MIEICADLFESLNEPLHRVGLSTNGTIKRNGQGVMGRGCALTAAQMHPALPQLLGQHLKAHGNVPGSLVANSQVSALEHTFLILPVKHQWYQEADVDLITMSVRYLDRLARDCKDWTFHVPRLGCGNGRLSWDGQVRKLMQELPDNVVVHH